MTGLCASQKRLQVLLTHAHEIWGMFTASLMGSLLEKRIRLKDWITVFTSLQIKIAKAERCHKLGHVEFSPKLMAAYTYLKRRVKSARAEVGWRLSPFQVRQNRIERSHKSLLSVSFSAGSVFKGLYRISKSPNTQTCWRQSEIYKSQILCLF